LKATFFMATFVGAAVVIQPVWNVEEAMHLIEEHGEGTPIVEPLLMRVSSVVG
jgi:hypothetical protein